MISFGFGTRFSFGIISVAIALKLVFAHDLLSKPTSGQPSSEQEPKPKLGIVSKQPTAGSFVELPNQTYMVPYTTSIPGTDVEFTMMPIPGGTFLLGSPANEVGRQSDESPQVEVTVEPFWIGKYEVTWAEYDAFQDVNFMLRRIQFKSKTRVVNKQTEIDGVSGPSSLYDPSFVTAYGYEPNQPAAMMTQFAAKQYTKFLSLLSKSFYRLPTEAEWEYACRAGTKTAYSFGNSPEQLGQYGWFGENSDETRHSVGQKKPNAWGVFDMHGNVAEWTLDQYSEQGYLELLTNTDSPPLRVTEAFRKPTRRSPLVLRGGGFLMAAPECRSAARFGSEEDDWKQEDPDFPRSPWWFTDETAAMVGFRIIRPLTQPANRTEMESAWAPAEKQVFEDALMIWENNGRGFYGVIDPTFADDIRLFLEQQK